MVLTYDAIIIGSGHNGLITAGYLAKAGLKVLVAERRDFVGGASVTEEFFPGYRFSHCSFSAHALQGKVVKDLELRKYGLDIYEISPRSFTPFPNNRHIVWWEEDLERTAREMARLSEHDARTFPEWTEFWRRAGDVVSSFFLTSPPTKSDLLEKAKETGDDEVLEKVFDSSIREIVDEFFEDDDIKGFMCASAGPDEGPNEPGSAFILSHFRPTPSHSSGDSSEDEPTGLIRGGMGSLTTAMAKSFQNYGGDIITGVEVDNIIVRNNKSEGIRLKDGKEITSKITISNADPKRTYLKLVGDENLEQEFVKHIQNLKTRSASMKLQFVLNELPDFSSYLGKNYDPKYLGEVCIAPHPDAIQKSWEEAISGKPTRNPIIFLQNSSVYDTSMAPAGYYIMGVWTQFWPRHLKEGSWNEIREREGEFIIDTISKFAPNFRKCIKHWIIFTPLDLEEKIGLTDGNIRHIDMITSQMISNRPHYRSPITGLYLCGAGTHPGGEVTGAPGHNAAQVILEDFRQNKV